MSLNNLITKATNYYKLVEKDHEDIIASLFNLKIASNENSLTLFTKDHYAAAMATFLSEYLEENKVTVDLTYDNMKKFQEVVVVPVTHLINSSVTWRLSKGVYCFPEHLYNEITKSTLTGKMPIEIFKRLPEYGILLDMSDSPNNNEGVLVSIIDSANQPTLLLKFFEKGPPTLNLDLAFIRIPLKEELTVEDYFEVLKNEQNHVVPATLAEDVYSALNLLLFICSESAEYRGGTTPSYTKPTKTKKGTRFFTAPNPKLYHLGDTLEKQIIKYKNKQDIDLNNPNQDRSVRPHLRRAHWNHYWVGKGRTKLIAKWIHQVYVGGE